MDHGNPSCCPAQHPARPGCDHRDGPIIAPGAAGDTGSAMAISLPGGTSTVGTAAAFLPGDGEGPPRRVTIPPFRIDAMAVTNARFGRFVAATGYRTEAERFGWSFVFHSFATQRDPALRVLETPWWYRVDGADWSAPDGPGSDVTDRQDHPAVHISWNDAAAFAAWAGGRLPTEAEWEYAAKGGADTAKYPWGEQEPDDRNALCNIWQGRFPYNNTKADGYVGTAPVDSFVPNGFGLYNLCGNAWEWCADPFRVRSLATLGKRRNLQAAAERERVMKGGSYLCHRSYCYRYRVAARSGRSPDTSAGHTGFRVAYAAARDRH